MPIRPEFRHFYGREWSEVTRPRILARAVNCCERCHKPNRLMVWVFDSHDSGQYWTLSLGKQAWIYCALGGGGSFFLNTQQVRQYRDAGRLRKIRVVLTIAHLNHKPGDDRDENLAALCGWCHLHYDQKLHVQSSRETRMDRKDAARGLFQEAIA